MNALERWKWRKDAFHAWRDADGDPERAEQILRAKYVGVSPAVLLMIMQFALDLFQWWIDHKQGKPESYACQAEIEYFDMKDSD